MFYVGDILWMEKIDKYHNIPNHKDFSGCVRWTFGKTFGRLEWFKDGRIQSPQDPVTGEWLPAVVWPNGLKEWFDDGRRHSFPSQTYPVTGERMPAEIHPTGERFWYDRGEWVPDPTTFRVG